MSNQAPDDRYVRTGFLERVAHELRGPAGVTVGALDEIERALGADAERLRAQFAMARRGVSRVVRAADRLQRTAQLERGDATFRMATVDVRPIAERAATEARAIEARRKIDLEVTADETACVCSVDAEWFQSAIAEIVANALRFARTRVHVETRTAGGEITITVRDDGPGFAGVPSFERFQAPATGGGLGLSLPARSSRSRFAPRASRGLSPVGRHLRPVGELRRSHPSRSGGVRRRGGVVTSRAEGGTLNVLVVDDDDDNSDLLGMFLEREGWTVTCARDLGAARDALNTDTFAALVTDLNLPDGRGTSLLANGRPSMLRAAVAVTGSSRGIDQKTCTESGFDALFVKPIDVDALVSLVKRLLLDPSSEHLM